VRRQECVAGEGMAEVWLHASNFLPSSLKQMIANSYVDSEHTLRCSLGIWSL
jgi:hypothetical protein